MNSKQNFFNRNRIIILIAAALLIVITITLIKLNNSSKEKDAPYGPGRPHLENVEQSDSIVPESVDESNHLVQEIEITQ